MDNIFHITKCDMCGREIYEKYTGPHDSSGAVFPSPSHFERKSYTMLMINGDETKKWTLCKRCGDAVVHSVEDISNTFQNLEEPQICDAF